jgi:anthranilate synthase component 2
MMSKILVIDNYDSFVYNIVHYLRELGEEVTVKRNDQFELNEILEYDKVVLSPGPGIPSEAGKLLEVIEFNKQLENCIPMLGICLGHQAIAEVFGGTLRNLSQVYHGIASNIKVDPNTRLYQNFESKLTVGRYHSWVADIESAPLLKANAWDQESNVMSLEHIEKPIWGIQYHPESILTDHGIELLQNWLKA